MIPLVLYTYQRYTMCITNAQSSIVHTVRSFYLILILLINYWIGFSMEFSLMERVMMFNATFNRKGEILYHRS